MENFISFLQLHAPSAHWVLFGAALLAGLNIPISIDLLMIIGATLAATLVPEHVFHLFLALFFGCALSAWLSYWMGRLIGPKLLHLPFFSKVFSPKRMRKVKAFYAKRGPYALLLGRFIPFGVRNCLYMSSGMSRMSFPKFIASDGLACGLWSSLSFFLYYSLGKNIETLYSGIKWVNLAIFLSFSVTVIALIWYKKEKKNKDENV
ncbi:MAG: DedA family protein [Simkaniaceae bacterium]|nr:DedA family protein [Candidatus Sacchlamyda saccharinae]